MAIVRRGMPDASLTIYYDCLKEFLFRDVGIKIASTTFMMTPSRTCLRQRRLSVWFTADFILLCGGEVRCCSSLPVQDVIEFSLAKRIEAKSTSSQDQRHGGPHGG